MAGARIAGFAGLLAACAAWPAAAQVEPHRPPEHLRALEIPPSVMDLPPLDCHEVSAPRPAEAKRPPAPDVAVDLQQLLGLKDLDQAAPTGGDPRAETVEALCWLPKATVLLARAGLWKRATEAGERLFREPKTAYGDFTWDLSATAYAWAWVQLGDLERAAVACTAAALRIEDPDVRRYHQTAGALLRAPPKTAEELKDPATFRTEMRKKLLPLAEDFKQSAGLVRTASNPAARLKNLNEAYKRLRALAVADAEVATALAASDFAPAADSLMTETAPPLLRYGAETVARLEVLDRAILPRSRWNLWNEQVTNLWAAVREVKRLARLHDYLARQGLARPGKEEAVFVEAHRLLFAPDRDKPTQPSEERTYVYQPIGHVMPGGIGIDARKRVPYTMTKLRPM
jgi:hypothetical protein